MVVDWNTAIATVIVSASWLVETPQGISISLNVFFTILAFLRWRPSELSIIFSLGVVFSKEVLLLANYLVSLTVPSQIFIFLFIFKFLKVGVHTISFITYRTPKPPINPTYSPADCTVIIPTVGDMGDEFVETVRSILACYPGDLIVSTVGAEKLARASKVCNEIDPNILCMAIDCPSKRNQFMAAVTRVSTPLVVSADDHVFWPPTFLDHAITAFEDPIVGLVGTVKRVRRQKLGWSFADFVNLMACLYLERHNFECTASYNVDGGVFVISGRTALYRTSIIQAEDFQSHFMNEYWLFGKVGPLNVDDDNCISRWMVNKGLKTVFLNSPDAIMGTSLGIQGGWKKFRSQMTRWARTTWRSNTITLFEDRTVWRSHPWCTYAVYFSAFVNLALLYDPALFIMLYSSSFYSPNAMLGLAGLLILSKLVKPFPHYMRNPSDLVYLPGQILFGYYHSWVKFHALFTCTNLSWGTRSFVDEQNVVKDSIVSSDYRQLEYPSDQY